MTVFIDEKRVAQMLGMTRQWLQLMRVKGGGPPFHKFGASVRYDIERVEAWIASRQRSHTGQEPKDRAPKRVQLPYPRKRVKLLV